MLRSTFVSIEVPKIAAQRPAPAKAREKRQAARPAQVAAGLHGAVRAASPRRPRKEGRPDSAADLCQKPQGQAQPRAPPRSGPAWRFSGIAADDIADGGLCQQLGRGGAADNSRLPAEDEAASPATTIRIPSGPIPFAPVPDRGQATAGKFGPTASSGRHDTGCFHRPDLDARMPPNPDQRGQAMGSKGILTGSSSVRRGRRHGAAEPVDTSLRPKARSGTSAGADR